MDKNYIIMVHLWHPCYDIDVTVVKNEDEKAILVNQGYVALNDIRSVMDVPKEEENDYINNNSS